MTHPAPGGAIALGDRGIANMTMQAGNISLAAARSAKNDEFYTQWADIEREVNAYLCDVSGHG